MWIYIADFKMYFILIYLSSLSGSMCGSVGLHPHPCPHTRFFVALIWSTVMQVKQISTSLKLLYSHTRMWLGGVPTAAVCDWIQFFVTHLPQLQQQCDTSARTGGVSNSCHIPNKHQMTPHVYFAACNGSCASVPIHFCCCKLSLQTY